MVAATACGSQRQLTTASATEAAATAIQTTPKSHNAEALQFMQRIADNALYQQNVVANLSFTLNKDGNEITVPGILRMRKDQVIRLQLLVPVLRSEIGRIEFTPDGGLFVDRYHRQYVKAKYSEVDFLRDNGITFYSLQALFWNQLLLPGEQRVGESQLNAFTPDLSSSTDNVPVKYQDGKIDYAWTASRRSAQILSTLITYHSTAHGTSSLQWDYADFKAFGSKQFPFTHEVKVRTDATGKQIALGATFALSDIKADSNWETETTLSSKYEQVTLEEVLQKLIRL